jgi:hypothetical protein
MQALPHERSLAPLTPSGLPAVFGLGDPLDALPEAPTHQDIVRFAAWVMKQEQHQGVHDLGIAHHHADKLYGRSGVVKAGSFIVGLPHKASGLSISVGDITVWTTRGRKRYTGAHILATEVGAMRIGYAHEDTTLFTTHANNTGSTDMRVIEDALVEHAELLQTRRLESLQ